ncbi:HotDog domain-containing protein [Gilbertella persicaria]|uniref:HotDog domain-containing protein n=1 Tax=Gilbertella persicaria TaxID=101096 RepID=UPI002220C2CE|nr:HotDog domain-containing protein [Gilbertella persicaria]KAI8058674.1 HotDog domain-containing protein [Gilbertella persicaria]
MNSGSRRLSLIASHLASNKSRQISTKTFRNRHDYTYFLPIQTRKTNRYLSNALIRWSDADVYGHINNSIYYHYFDTVINEYLIKHCGLEPNHNNNTKPIGLVVASQANFYASATYPNVIQAGLCITKIGKSSVTYRIGIFEAENPLACVVGGFTHVFVDPENRRPVQSLPKEFLEGMEKMLK